MRGKAFQLGALVVVAASAATCMMDFDEFDHMLLPTSTSTSTTSTGTGGAGGTIFTGGGGTSTSGTGGSTSGTGGSTGGSGGSTSSGGGGGAGGGAVTVACDEAPCDLSNDGHCCLPQSGGTPTCESQGNDCAEGYAEVHCDEPGDCPGGDECCATFDYQTGFTLIECVGNCGGPDHFTVCDSNNDCGGNDNCETSSYLPSSYQVCK
jgi:hypothetical protein